MRFLHYLKAALLLAVLAISAPSQATVWTVTDANDFLAPGTLRFSVDNSSPGDTIMFAVAVCNINTGPLTPAHNLVFIGNGSGNTAIDGGGAWQLFSWSAPIQITIRDLTLRNSDASTPGGAIFVGAGDLQIRDCILHDNHSSVNGGAISVDGTMTARNVNFWNNASNIGGALYVGNNGDCDIDTAQFNDNTVLFRGGAVYLDNNVPANSLFNHCTFDNNKSNDDGGALYKAGSATNIFFNRCQFTNDTAGSGNNGGAAAINGGNVNIDSTQIHNCWAGSNGGGIYTTMPITINSCLIDTNTATFGGGLYLGGAGNTASSNNTFVGNIALTSGGGIYTNNHQLDLTNCTFSENTASFTGGGVYYTNGSSHTTLNTTFTLNISTAGPGGGFYATTASTVINLENTICAQNSGTGGEPDISNQGAVVTSNNHNLIGDTTGSNVSWMAGDLVGGAAVPLDPQLDPLAFLISLPVHMPSCGSPAIDNGSLGAPANDQIGNPRVNDADIGAVEYQGGASGGIYTVNNPFDNGVGSLRYGIESTCADTIDFGLTMTGQTISLSTGQFNLDRNLVIMGLGSADLTVDAGGASRFFTINAGDTIEISGITFANGDVGATNGGAIWNNGVLKLDGVDFAGNNSLNNGGAIYNTYEATIQNCNFTGNSGNRGGGYYSNGGGSTLIDSSVFVGNTATLRGGAINGIGGSGITYNILNSSFQNNSTNGDGGGIWISVSTTQVNINSCTFDNNDATGAVSKGGSLWIYTTTTTTQVDSCVFINSDAPGGGGGTFVDNGDVTFGYCLFDNNSANSGTGGGLFADGGAGFDVTYSTFSNNQADHGGGLAIQSGNGSSIHNSTIHTNQTVSGDGGGLALDGTFLDMTNCTFSGNTSTASGGAMVLINGAYINAISNTFAFNVSVNTQGEHIYMNGSNFDTEGAIIANGTTSNDIFNVGGTLASFGNNLIGDTTSSNATWQGSDIVGGALTPVDPALDPLADNGGVTWTHSFPCWSPAMDNGNPGAPANDQIDQPRLGTPDIGAYERQIASGGTYTVTTIVDGGPNSLRYGIDSTCVDTIIIAPGLSGATLDVSSGAMDVNRDLVIIGITSNQMTVDAGNNDRIFNIGFLNQVNLSGMRLQNGNAGAGNGGAIYNGGYLTMNDVRFTGNTAVEGGAIYNDDEGNIIADSCKFDLNNAVSGGAVALFNHNTNSVDFTYTSFFDNTATDGGAIYTDSTGVKTLITCEVFNNIATNNGGGIFSQWGAFFADSTTFWGNGANVGGAVHINNSNGFAIRSSSFFLDTAAAEGGALFANNSAGFLWNNTFNGNETSTGNGGAIAYVDGNLDLNSNSITQNIAGADGGGFSGTGASHILNFNNNIIADNYGIGSIYDLNSGAGTTINSGGYNFIGVGDQTGQAVSWDVNDITGTFSTPIFPDLEQLANNGGPTQTRRPNCGSPVIDAGDPTNAPAADQLGQPRVGQTDIGAFEHQAPATAPTATISGSAEMCRNNIASDSLTVTLTGTPPFTFVASNGTDQTVFSNILVNSFNFLPQDTGTYSIPMIADANCTNFTNTSGTVQVTASTLAAAITAQTDAACATADGDATVTAIGGSGNYGYLWTNGDTITLADSIAAGYYMVTVTDQNSGCATTAVAHISNIGAPTLNVLNVTDISCNGLNDGGIDVSVSGGSGNYEFLWSTGSPSEDAVGMDAGPAEIRVTDIVTGCVVIQSIMINEPDPVDVTVNGTDATCGVADGSAIAVASGGTAPYNYTWSSGGTTATETALGYGIYTVDVIDNNGCTTTGVVAISEVGAANVQIDSTDRPNCNSSNGAVYISANGTGTLTYDWNSGLSSSEDLTNVPFGVYQVEVTDASGCVGVNGVPLLNARPESPFLCIVTVDTATQNNLIGWEKTTGLGIEKFWVYRESSLASIYQKIANVPFDSLSQFIDTVSSVDQQAWRYQVRAIDSCGNGSWLSNSVSHRTIHVSGHAKQNGDVIVLWNDYDGFEVDKYYIWRHTLSTGFNLIDSVDYPGNLYLDTPPGYDSLFYRVDVKNPFPCVVSRAAGNNNASKSNESDLISPPTDGLYEGLEGANLSVYPIPSRDIVNVVLDQHGMKEAVITIYDVDGRVVKTSRVSASGSQLMHQFNLSSEASGVYFLEIWTRDKVYNRKLVIE